MSRVRESGPRSLKWALLAALCLGVAAAAPSRSQTVDPALAESYNAGLEAANLGNFALAKEKFEAALAIDPGYKDAHYNLGLVLQNLDQHAEAAKHFAKTLEIDPGNPTALRLHADALLRSQQFARALAAYDKAIAADSTRVDLYYAAADAASKAYPEELSKVIPVFERALSRAPKDPKAYTAAVSLGVMCSKAEDYPAALSAYQRAAKLKPNEETPHYNCAVVLQKMKRYNDAVESLKKAIELESPNGKAHFALAGIYYNQLKNDQLALEHYEAAAADKTFKSRKKAEQYAQSIRDYLTKKKEQEQKQGGGSD